MARDDFLITTKRKIAERVGYKCSNPGCACITVAADSSVDDSISIGVAAHITAASQGGPRYDNSLNEKERTSTRNGIWLCQNCAKLIDSDIVLYSVDILVEWKTKSEKLNRSLLGKSPIGKPYLDEISSHLKLEPDYSFKFHSTKIKFSAHTMEDGGITMVKMSFGNSKMPSDHFAAAVTAERAFMVNHLDSLLYMQLLGITKDGKFEIISGTSNGITEQFESFKETWPNNPIFEHIWENRLIDVVAGHIGGEWHNFLFDLTDVWDQEFVRMMQAD